MTCVYILKSLRKGIYYVGSTNNWRRRFAQHTSGKVRSTKWLRPLQVMLVQEYSSLSNARRIEYRIKRLKRRDYIDKMVKDGIIYMDP